MIADGVSIDSRATKAGQLFVPIVAERDGHLFVPDAVSAGAVAYLTERDTPGVGVGGATAVRVKATDAALAGLAAWSRDRLPDRVVGVTGSNGKTSTKDLLAAVLGRRWQTAASTLSFNNELGVPLTLLNAPDGTEAAVVEMGARAPGDIDLLCQQARPTVGIVTNVGMAHTEMFGSLDGVARAKAELVRALSPTGTAVLNAEDDRVLAMATATAAHVVTFGLGRGDVRVDGSITMAAEGDDRLRPRFRLHTPAGDADVLVTARGAHQVSNALAAAAAALALGVGLDDVVTGLARAPVAPWRMSLSTTRSGAVVINDAYNANPASMIAALESARQLAGSRLIAVLGPMYELGPASEEEHRRTGQLARDRYRVDQLISVGAPAYGGEDVATIEDALERLGSLQPGDVVLVKASRAAGLERLAAALTTEVSEARDPSEAGERRD